MGQMCSFGTKEEPLETSPHGGPSSGGGKVNTAPTIPSKPTTPSKKPAPPPSDVQANVASWQSKANQIDTIPNPTTKPTGSQIKTATTTSPPAKATTTTTTTTTPVKTTTVTQTTTVSQPAKVASPQPTKSTPVSQPASDKTSTPPSKVVSTPAKTTVSQPVKPVVTTPAKVEPTPAKTIVSQPVKAVSQPVLPIPAKVEPTPAKAAVVSQPAKAAAVSRQDFKTAPVQTGKPCGRCNKPVGKDVIEAMGKEFHVECFICDGCSKPIEGRFASVGGKPMCPPCSVKKSAPKLSGAGPTGNQLSKAASVPANMNAPMGPTGSAISKATPKATGMTGLFQWAKNRTEGYDGVDIKNWTTSWQDGLAYCALLHSYYPNMIDYKSLKKENKQANIDLAYSVADKLGIVYLLDKEDFGLEKLSMMTQMSEVYKTLNK